MKKQSQNSFAPLSSGHVETLTEVVKETLAIGFTHPKTFTTIDLWNIQRRGKATARRRYFA